MQSKTKTVKEYLASLPADRRQAIEAVRKVILKNLDKVYEEGMSYGMIAYCVPHKIYPPGYHCDPKQALPFAGLASQKNYMSVYIACEDAKQFRREWARTGKKLDMGKVCIRFKKLDDLALELIGKEIARFPARKFIAYYESVMKPSRKKKKSRAKK